MPDDGQAQHDHQPDPGQRAAEAPGPRPRPEPANGTSPTGDANPYRVPPSSPGASQGQPAQQPQPPGWAPPPGQYGHQGPSYADPYGSGPYGAGQSAPYQGQQAYGYGPPAYGYGPPSPYQAPYPYGYGPPARPQTESLAVLALVLAIVAVFLMPIVPALAAYVVAARARSSITASYGARGGLGMVSAARWIATIHLLLVIPGSILFGIALFPLGWLV